MNHLRYYCLSCWIPASKDKTEDRVDQDDNEEKENSDRSSLSSSHNAPPSQARHSVASATAPSVDAAASPAPGAEFLGSETEATENYISLDKCFSGARPTKVQTMPRLVQRDFHLLDLVPPSPCSLRENLGSLSGMPEVYAPMSPHKTSSRAAARGSLGGVGARSVDGSNKIQQTTTPQGRRKELFTFEMKIPENQTSSNQSLKADLQNGRTVFSAQADHGHRLCSRIELQNRIPCTSISSEASSVETRACHKPSETLHSLHSSSSTDHTTTDQPHYCNICANPIDGVDGGQGLPIDDEDTIEFSDSNGKWHATDAKSHGCSWKTEEAYKVLHVTPPRATAAQKNKPRLQKYVNARSNDTDFDVGDVSGFETSYPSAVRSCPEESTISSCDGYYNILPNNSHSSRAEYAYKSSPPPPLPPPCHCHGHPGCVKKQLKPKLNPEDRHRSDSVILPVRKKSTNNDDSSSSNDEAELCGGGSSPANSNTSLNNKFINSFQFNGFASKPPAPPPAPPQSIEYLQLDLDQPISGSRGSPNAVHHSFNSAPIDYIKIDPFRTKALSEAKKQLDSNRQNGKIPLH